MGDNQDFFYVCDLAKDAAEQVDINYDGLAPYMDQIVTASYMPFGPYDPNTQSFTASIQLLDGTYLTLILYTQGENRGKVTVLHEGESDAGQVISVMVRLNYFLIFNSYETQFHLRPCGHSGCNRHDLLRRRRKRQSP